MNLEHAPSPSPGARSRHDDGTSRCFVLGGEVMSPVMLLRESALQNNIENMAEFADRHGVLIAPHAKTTMSGELVRRQLGAGAWGMSVANGAQLRIVRSFGVKRLLLANQLVDTATIRWMVDDLNSHPENEFCCFVDSVEGVDLLENVLRSTPPRRRVRVLVELGPTAGRAGCRTIDQALLVGEAVDRASHLALAGVAGYDGVVGENRSQDTVRAVHSFCDFVDQVTTRLERLELLRPGTSMISMGGAFFDLVTEHFVALRADRPERILLLRPGGYISHDQGLYARVTAVGAESSPVRLESALELWGRVLSRPEPNLAILDIGRRNAPYDQDLPTPVTIRSADGSEIRSAHGMRITQLSDQHSYLRFEENAGPAVGEWVGCAVSHPCTAFDKWRELLVIDDDYTVVGRVTTRF
ncbi:alanine racemase [Nocardioides piscis]|uniref:Amino acid deaminase n=1 Tax=Nocardioides piscis TaxID=2714938 RepID=A0A6G7YJ79_9ACTN|nr:alanine racemase [Nocardioides piscis]QIK76795.1 amino acid deaminase [Nocardioides piscis]